MTLRLAPDLELPDAVLESHVAILGKTGSGKSNLAKTLVEGLLDQGARVCVIDPTGTWYGLRLTRDRTASPYQVVMFGGEHADIAIGRSHGAGVAETVGTTATPAVIDTLAMSVAERTEFFTAFAETLLQRNRGPLHLVLDEAHVFAPQGRVNDPRSGQMVHAANNLVSLGRGRGLRIILISQRPAKLHKDSLTQVETLIALRLIAPQDVRAVDDWIGEWADARTGAEIKASLPGLRTGEAWIWSPQAGVLERRQVPLARTLDTGKPSDQPIELSPIDVAAVRDRLGEVAAEAVANDPRTLRTRIRELERQLAERPAAEPEVVHVPVLAEGQAELLWTMAQDIITALHRVSAPTTDPSVKGRVADGPRGVLEASREAAGPAGGDLHSVVAARPVTATRPARMGDAPLGRAERLILAALSAYPMPLTRTQLAFLVDYHQNSKGFTNALGSLRSAGLITPGFPASLTPDGAAVDVDPLPGGGDPLETWLARFGRAERAILAELIRIHPAAAERVPLASIAGYEHPNSKGYVNAIGRLRGLGLVDGMALSPDFAQLIGGSR